jgi:hypothetical protein
MTKHTSRDEVWNLALQYATAKEPFQIKQISKYIDGEPSDRTIRDTLNTMATHGWLTKDTPHSSEWHPGPQIDNDDPPDTPFNQPGPSDTSAVKLDSVSSVNEGEVYVDEVGRHTGQNGIIDTRTYDKIPMDHINLGPINESAVGYLVKFEYIGGLKGECLTEEFISESYQPLGTESNNNSGTASENSTNNSESNSNGAPSGKPSEQSPEPSSDGTIVYHAEPGKAECIHVRENCSGLDNIQGELNSKIIRKNGEIPEEISHLRECRLCARGKIK